MDEKSILILLSEPLRDEIYSHIHGVVIKFCKIFDKFEGNFISQLSRTLINEMFAPSDTIIEEGEMTNKLYFIMNGKVIVYQNYTKSIIKELRENDYFGEISFFTENPRCASVKCIDFLDVLSLTRLNLNCLIEKFPEADNIIKNLSKSCEKGNFSELFVQCYICEEIGHYATKCSSIMINLDQEETRGKWLKGKHLRESKCLSLTKIIHNFTRKVKKRKNARYSSRNVVGVPRKTLNIGKSQRVAPSEVIETPPPVMESSTGDSTEQVKLIRIKPIYSELYINSESDPDEEEYKKAKEKEKENTVRATGFRLSLIMKQRTDKVQRSKYDTFED